MKVKRNIPLNKSLGEHLRELRVAKGISQEEFANMVGTSPSQIGRIERGESNPTVSMVDAMYMIFGISIGDLIGFNKS